MNEVLKAILSSFGEIYSKKRYDDTIETILAMCKYSYDFIDTDIEYNNKKRAITEFLNNKEITISPVFLKVLENNFKETVAKRDYLKEKVEKYFKLDYNSVVRESFDGEISFKKPIDIGEVLNILLVLDDKDLKKLNIKRDQIKSAFDAIQKGCVPKDIGQILEALLNANMRTLRKHDLDILLFESFGSECLYGKTSKNPYDNICNFIMNNMVFIINDKELVDKINQKLGYKLINYDDKFKCDYGIFIYVMLMDSVHDRNQKSLVSFLNMFDLMTKIQSKHGSKAIRRLLEINKEIHNSYRNRMQSDYLYDAEINSFGEDGKLTQSEIEELGRILSNNQNIFEILFDDKLSKGLANSNSKDEIILADILDPNGTFKGLTYDEIANILIEYFAYSGSDKIVSDNENTAFKDLSPLVEEIIENRQNATIDVISSYARNGFHFKEKGRLY